jgi:hypothetical protein
MATMFDRVRRVCLGGGNDRSAPVPKPKQPDKVMGSEVDYFGLASLMIHNHGTEARAEAVRLKEEALLEADSEAAYDWHAIEQAIGLLTDESNAARC